jgi:uncharacterized protein (DUF1810 family)
MGLCCIQFRGVLLNADTDFYNLQRFLNAQESTFDVVQSELAAGRKRTHWMWFVFPQIKGLGSSPTAQRFAISNPGEAAAYLEHPVLGRRLKQCTALVNSLQNRSVQDIFGYPDDLKFHSSMTLFVEVADRGHFKTPVFAQALEKYFMGRLDENTLSRLRPGKRLLPCLRFDPGDDLYFFD